MLAANDTITAISTAWGEAGIAIVRVSGPEALELARTLLRFGASGGFEKPRSMYLASLIDENDAIDQVLAVYFPGPKSYSGEDVVEIHTHGGSLVAQLCLEALIRRGARLAEPGEFTRRAFLNGRIDLAQAESVLNVIRSRSEEALRAAKRTLSGELSSFASEIREEVLILQGNLEVELDFPEEGVPYVNEEDLRNALATLQLGLEDLADRCSTGLLLNEGIRVALTGRPNVGKSSLLNALLKQARAIVTALPGTTRDVIEETITYRGLPIRLVDTAGLRVPSDEIEADGIERANLELRRSDVCLWVLDGSSPLSADEQGYLEQIKGKDHVIVLNKADLPCATAEETIRELMPESPLISVSAQTGSGLEALKERVFSIASDSGSLDAGLNVTARQLAEVREALSAITEAHRAAQEGTGQDVVAGLLGTARGCLDRLLGLSYDDALLDSIFDRFCVGK